MNRPEHDFEINDVQDSLGCELNNKLVCYVVHGQRPMFWLGGAVFSPYLDSALTFGSVDEVRQAVEADKNFPIGPRVKAMEISEIEKTAAQRGIQVRGSS